MSPKLSLSRQLDMACQNLNPTYAMQIDRNQINNFEDLLNAGKQVEIKLLNLSKYKEPPPPETSVLSNAAWHPPPTAKSPKKIQKEQKPHVKNEIASTKDVAAVVQKSEQPKKQLPKFDKRNDTPMCAENKSRSSKQSSATFKYPADAHRELPNPGECFKCRQQGHLFKD